MKRKFEVSQENQPKWNACISFTMDACIKDDPDMYVSKFYEKCITNFKTNNYPLDRTVSAKSKRVRVQKLKEAREQAKLREDPVKTAYLKQEMEKLKEEFPYKNKQQLREMAIHNWCLARDKDSLQKNSK